MPTNDLEIFLSQQGYVRVPLRRSAAGHFHADGSLNGRRIEVLVDTGASCTVISMALVRQLGLAAQRLDEDAGGAGGAMEQYLVAGAELRLADFAPRVRGPVGLDFEQVNAPLRACGSTEVDAILGADVFEAHAAVVDFAGQALFLRAGVVADGVGAGSPGGA